MFQDKYSNKIRKFQVKLQETKLIEIYLKKGILFLQKINWLKIEKFYEKFVQYSQKIRNFQKKKYKK